MGNFSSNLIPFLNKDVIVSTSLSDQLHGQIAAVEDDFLILQMADQKKIINIAHIISVTPKDSITT
ncbi:MAG: DUF2642 domain-containing protein [Candidatus Omnitrophica bacterium]|nr:DUF2642 domain-containing protein [Candidatus Omnitrophota bacterium]